MFVLVTGR